MLEQYRKAFKAYDIRGVYGVEIDIKFAYILGRAVGNRLKGQYEHPSFLLASDVRHQNTDLISHFLGGMQEEGVQDISIVNFPMEGFPYGICSTPTFFSLVQGDFDLGVSVTASHNSQEYVGMKFADRNVELISTDFLKQIFETFYFDDMYTKAFPLFDSKISDLLVQKTEKLTEFLLSKWDKLDHSYRFVVDFSSGAGVSFEQNFLKILSNKHTIISLNTTPDGTFSAHESDTSVVSNYKQLVEKVKQEGADFGMMFDGDADRIGFVSNSGAIIGGDMLTAIIAQQLLKQGGIGEILYDVMSTKLIEQLAKQAGGNARRSRTGRYFINKELNKKGGLFAGEFSGHYMFKEIGGYEMPLLAVFYIISALADFSDFDAMIDSLQTLYKSPTISLKVEDKSRSLQAIKEVFREFEQDYLDGVSVYGDDFWLNVRGSNTENKIRYTVEAESPEKRDEVLKLIGENV